MHRPIIGLRGTPIEVEEMINKVKSNAGMMVIRVDIFIINKHVEI